ncbi:MAG: hypothetical protein KY467_02870 [Gemmatimonadetes bacterium]|nr:hypothetical protein [Gemmatimonadota bacterium]
MSTPTRYAEAALAPADGRPVFAPLVRDRAAAPGPETPVNAHRVFYGMGYAGLVLVWAGVWLEGLAAGPFEFVLVIGIMFVALGGFGVVIHTLWKPNERKVRHLLLALAALGLTIAAVPLVNRIAGQMYAAAAADRLQPLAEALAKDTRIHAVGAANGRVILNGYHGPEHGPERTGRDRNERVLADVLARDGITRSELQAYLRRMERAGVEKAERTAWMVAFSPSGRSDLRLVYVLPGQPLLPAHQWGAGWNGWHSEPLGGAWYMMLPAGG